MKIPFRFILTFLLILAETAGVIAFAILCDHYIPYFHVAVVITQICCVIGIIGSDENPEYKAPWALFVSVVPFAGFMIYFMYYDRELSRRFIKRKRSFEDNKPSIEGDFDLGELEKADKPAALQARLLCRIAHTHAFHNTDIRYFSMGEEMFEQMIADLNCAERFIFLEYFIIQEGTFWNAILDILREKAAQGVEVRVIYDDIGCMSKVKGNYYRTLRKMGIKAVCFARFRPQATSEFNNRSHRKLMIIDNRIGYTGGVNIADEYINVTHPFGVWKDVGVRLEGAAVSQMTETFLLDYEMNQRKPVGQLNSYARKEESHTEQDGDSTCCVIPFRDDPKPFDSFQVSKIMIMNMLNQATDYVYMTSPYLIVDNEMCLAMENAAIRGVDVRIITPHIPDKKIVFAMTRSYYKRLLDAGVRIFEYEPGFIHAKLYLSDDKYAIVGTVNLDYRSLAHHFENGVWIYHHAVLRVMKADFERTVEASLEQTEKQLSSSPLYRLFQSAVRVIAPLM